MINMNIFDLVVVTVLAVAFIGESNADGNNIQTALREGVFFSGKQMVNLSSSNENWLPKYAPGMVSQACLDCICRMESGCKPLGCIQDVGSLSCGYFMIKEPYWIDCGRPGASWKSCANDLMCSSGCVQKYMDRYAKRYGCPLKCEGFAREHNGGPNGCNNPNTLGYWAKLQTLPGCKGVVQS